MAVTHVAHPITQCLHCKNPVFDNLTITNCNHIFHRTCLEGWFKHKKTCPIDQGNLSPQECNVLQVSFSMDSAEDEKFVISTLPKNLNDEVEKVCSICTDEFAPVYFIQENKGFMHTACWIELHPKETSPHPVVLPQQIATVNQTWIKSAKLPPPQPLHAPQPVLHSSVLAPPPTSTSPRKPPKPMPGGIVALLAISPFISIWAYFMNTRVYPKNTLLFVLSIPVLLIRNIFSIASFLFKRIFIERKV